MKEFESLADAQLMAIEQVYGIRIANRDEVARLIGERAKDRRQVLTICTSLNSWAAMNLEECLTNPSGVLEPLLSLADCQSRNA
jgi:hypothetical protein